MKTKHLQHLRKKKFAVLFILLLSVVGTTKTYAQNITFADENVKTICVVNWDTDGDGELSYAEAAAVTDLGVVFGWNENITSFEELQYFTNLTSIGEDAFCFCFGLTSIAIPNSVTSICGGAFTRSGLTSIAIPNSVTSIGETVFYACAGLTSIAIPNSVTSIGELAFSGCTGLTSIAIPNSVTSIGDGAFSGCSGLTSIVVDEGNTAYDSRGNCNAIIETETNTLITGCQNTVVPNTVSCILGGAFSECTGLTSIEIPNSVTTIGGFSGCTGLTSIEIPNSVTSIGAYAFYGCTGLTSIEIPNSVTYIGSSAFSECTGLTSIEIPNSVTSIGGGAFSGCSGLTSIVIPNSVTSIGSYAFLGCNGLTMITVLANTPPVLEWDVFKNVNPSIPVYVPCASFEAYQEADGWNVFTNYQCLDNTFSNHEYVDLGLPSGILWATCNVGADAPEEYGDYFAWGETQPKDYYDWSTYQYCDGNQYELTKYDGLDNLIVLQPDDDAATTNLGTNWIMPTAGQWQELFDNTSTEWTTQNDVEGWHLTATNGNSLFLPAAGCHYEGDLNGAGSDGNYWTRLLNTDDPRRAKAAFFDMYNETGEINPARRMLGYSVRPVYATSASTTFTINATAWPEEGGTVNGGGSYEAGTECTLTATANEDYYFVKWTCNGIEVATDPTFSFTVTDNANYVAVFRSLVEHSGIILGYTGYDWQSNCGARTWTHVWPDGTVGFAYTIATTTNFADRGTGIGLYKSASDEWIPLGGRIENEKTGFGSMARYGQNGLVVAAHTATDLGIYIVEDKDNMTPNSVGASLYTGTDLYTHPAVMTSGPDRKIIHVAAAKFGEYEGESYEPIRYWRSSDGGQTWDKVCVELPYLTTEYGINWGTNSYYWMETSADNRLALVINCSWSDGIVIYSDDNGETWERIVFYQHPNPFGYFETPFYYPRWTSCQWDSQHHLHVLYEFGAVSGEAGSSTNNTAIGGVAYWNEEMPYNLNGTTMSAIEGNLIPGQPFVMDSAYVNQDIYRSWWNNPDAIHEMWPEYFGYLPPLTDEGIPEDPYQATEFNIEDGSLHGLYHSGVCGFPVLCMVPNSNEMVAVWSALDENHTDGSGLYYYKIFASYSNDGGATWSPMIRLTNDSTQDYSEFVYNQAAVVGRKLIIASQTDAECGTFVQSETDFDGSNNYYQGFVFDIDALFSVENVTQTLELTAGWNWISVDVDITLDDLKAAVLAATPGALPVIKSKSDGQTFYNGALWVGALREIDLSQMYEIKVANPCTITLEGSPINPADHPVTIKKGANWIAYPLRTGTTVTNAFVGFAAKGDNVKSKNDGQATWNNVIWTGALRDLEPGKGYIYTSTATGDKTFTFPTDD